MPLNRIVVLLTPVFVGLSGWLVQWIADHFPGAPRLDEGELTALFLAGAVAGLTAASQWLRGHQKHEAREADAGTVAAAERATKAARDLERALHSKAIDAKNKALLLQPMGMSGAAAYSIVTGESDPDLDPEKGNGENVAVELGVLSTPKTDPSTIPADRGDAEVAEKDRP